MPEAETPARLSLGTGFKALRPLVTAEEIGHVKLVSTAIGLLLEDAVKDGTHRFCFDEGGPGAALSLQKE
ncbi:MAG TPA: hypothetical protein VFA71_09210 [Terriglobales bacterium]|nr:hypothetical protein [Terriglobales bacterium]